MYHCNCCSALVTFTISSIDERLELAAGNVNEDTNNISSLYIISKKRKRVNYDDNLEDSLEYNICRKKLKKC